MLLDKVGVRGFARDILVIYLSYRLIKVWVFSSEFTTGMGLLTLLLFGLSVWFMIERFTTV